MSDFVTMQCPSCGGKLAVAANALSLRCEHCGSEHMIRREAGAIVLEAYARCPVCNRNDRVEKVTAILGSQTHSAQGIAYQTQPTAVRVGGVVKTVNQQVAVPVQTSQTSDLAKRLAPPPKPQSGKNIVVPAGTSGVVLTVALLTALAGIVSLVGTLSVFLVARPSGKGGGTFAGILPCVLVTMLPIGLSILLFVVAVPHEMKANQAKTAAAGNRRRELVRQAEEGTKRWNLAMERWNRLYYCGRDDCVFLPGTNTYAPITGMGEYLYRP